MKTYLEIFLAGFLSGTVLCAMYAHAAVAKVREEEKDIAIRVANFYNVINADLRAELSKLRSKF